VTDETRAELALEKFVGQHVVLCHRPVRGDRRRFDVCVHVVRGHRLAILVEYGGDAETVELSVVVFVQRVFPGMVDDRGFEADRAQLDDVAVVIFSRRRTVGAGVRREKIVERAVFLDDDDDVFDRHRRLRRGAHRGRLRDGVRQRRPWPGARTRREHRNRRNQSA
jgi:hypothetical protein